MTKRHFDTFLSSTEFESLPLLPRWPTFNASLWVPNISTIGALIESTFKFGTGPRRRLRETKPLE